MAQRPGPAHPHAGQPAAPTPRRAHPGDRPLPEVIETLNSQLAEQFHVECNKAKSVAGLCARLQAKLAAHTVGVYLNCLLGRPLLHLKDLALI